MGEGWPTRRKYVGMNLVWFAAILAFGATLAVVLLYKPGAVSARDLARLEKGMTQPEVIAILGEPKVSVRAAVVRDDPEEVWTYSLPPSRWSVTELDWQLKFYQGELDSWWRVDQAP